MEEVQSPPLLRVVRGTPDATELAALVAVTAALASSAPTPSSAPPSPWRDHAPLLRRPLFAGPGAWHSSSLPR